MLEKLLQAATITFLLNLLMAMSSPSAAPKSNELQWREILMSAALSASQIPQECLANTNLLTATSAAD
ncbi:MAG: hypothetical protein MUC60_02250 [Oscillatoria sp. Prado101]|jgi:hypothetical protein|nr:hypothetical protein [Oscillatoria sp. Prado101]